MTAVLFILRVIRQIPRHYLTSEARASQSAMKEKRVFILRIVVAGSLLAVAVVLGTLVFITLQDYERNGADYRYENIAKYADASLVSNFKLMGSGIRALAKSMGHISNSTAWPNVKVPGFYDVAPSHRDSLNLGDIHFMPLVLPSERLSFQDFMYDYYAKDPAIGRSAGITSAGKGIFALGPRGAYIDETGEALAYYSPNKILTPLMQITFNQYFQKFMLAINMHSFKAFGPTQDFIIECSRHHNYSTVYDACGSVVDIDLLPFGSTLTSAKDVHTGFVQPIFRNENSSELVGFMGGGFNWLDLLLTIFRYNQDGIDVVVKNGDITFTMVTEGDGLLLKGFEDSHDTKYDNKVRTVTFFERADGSPAYTVSIYPTDHFYDAYETDFPAYATAACVIVLVLCASTFLLYDYYMRKATAANEAVLETKRRFVRFISHEIRTPLNAVHLGLEALIAEVKKAMDLAVTTGNKAVFKELLQSWLELSTEMMANSTNAEHVLDDLLNYDKIEIGALYLAFACVPIYEIVRSKVVAAMPQMHNKNVFFNLNNRLAPDGDQSRSDLEAQVFSQYQVIGDAARLAQVIRTLIENALKFTPHHGTIELTVERIEGGIPHFNLVLPPESVHLLEQPRAGSIRISVTDSGDALSEAQIATISAEGVQFNANELQAGKGSGLGLYIAKGIVEQHGGTLTVSSAGLEHGTSFVVELPLFLLPAKHEQTAPVEENLIARAAHSLMPRRASQISAGGSSEQAGNSAVRVAPDVAGAFAQAPPRSSRSQSSGPSPSHSSLRSSAPSTSACDAIASAKERPKRILVVDDVGSNRKMLIRILTTKGFECEQAEDGQQAIDVYLASLASGRSFDAITMDFEMPVMNGPTATGHLRAMECTIPIIGVTGNMLPDDIKYFKMQGATEVLGKPLNISKFQDIMSDPLAEK